MSYIEDLHILSAKCPNIKYHYFNVSVSIGIDVRNIIPAYTYMCVVYNKKENSYRKLNGVTFSFDLFSTRNWIYCT